MSYSLDGREVKVGDCVYCLLYGEGTVCEIVDNCIAVEFSSVSYIDYIEGNKLFPSAQRTLYWSKPIFEIPKPPKAKVKKYLVVFTNNYGYGVSTNHYRDKNEFYDFCDSTCKFVQLIEDSVQEFDDE